MTRIEIEIGEVILRGVPPEQTDQVVAELHRRLRELAGAGSADVAAPAGRDRAVVPARRSSATIGPGELGAHAADTVWSAVSDGDPK